MRSERSTIPSCTHCGSFLPLDSSIEFDIDIEDDSQVDALRDEIDVHIARLKQQLWELSRRRNKLAKINRRLPPEIIRKVFLECSIQEEDVCFRKQIQWTRITHVCSQWRAQAIDHAELWSRIPLRTVFWGQKMLERTKQACVSLEFKSTAVVPRGFEEIQSIASRLLAQTSRLRTVELEASTKQITQLLGCFDSTSNAPALEYLSIRATPSYLSQSDWGSPEEGPMPLPDQFLSAGAPRLHTLLLHNCTLHKSIPYTSNTLTTLVAEYEHPSPRFVDAISTLQNLRNLTLKVGNAGILPITEVTYEITPIFLPQLEALRLQGNFFLCVNTLACLRMPPSAILGLGSSRIDGSETQDPDAFDAAVSHLQAILGTSWLTSPLSVFRTISVNAGIPGYPGADLNLVEGWIDQDSPPRSSDQHETTIPSLAMSVDLRLASKTWWLKSMPLQSSIGLRRLEIGLPGLDADSFRQISVQFPLLEHITVGFSCAHTFVDAIQSDATLQVQIAYTILGYATRTFRAHDIKLCRFDQPAE
ncbi:hypothetical protein FA15DRAFT_321655 [Coprinopsis marcescibilis]|uniref:Uncharacterized protein n=1 Tax=Coprinopsis marcescibilis TaxID=230819 RepID=A0A5C3KZJ8_COPMA|nr:hypothetical protein FA15DRAFT_321655 [Coprinopsis marcescibilis]